MKWIRALEIWKRPGPQSHIEWDFGNGRPSWGLGHTTFIPVAIRCEPSHSACLHLSPSSYHTPTINVVLRTLSLQPYFLWLISVLLLTHANHKTLFISPRQNIFHLTLFPTNQIYTTFRNIVLPFNNNSTMK